MGNIAAGQKGAGQAWCFPTLNIGTECGSGGFFPLGFNVSSAEKPRLAQQQWQGGWCGSPTDNKWPGEVLCSLACLKIPPLRDSGVASWQPKGDPAMTNVFVPTGQTFPSPI